MAKTKKPLDEGFKRTLKIVGGVLGVSVVALGAMAYTSGQSKEREVTPSVVGTPPTGTQKENPQINEATRRRLERVQESEAAQARKGGHSYIPDVILSGGEPIEIKAPEPKPEPAPIVTDGSDAPPPRRASASMDRQQDALAQARNEAHKAEMARYQAGLERQLAAVLQGLSPATVQEVGIVKMEKPAPVGAAGSAKAGATQADIALTAERSAAKGEMLVGGDEIVAAVLITPVNTDKSRSVLVEIVGGKLDGAQLRGEVVPMATSGDIEDVGLRFTSMRLVNGDHFQISAIGLNESTASDAMDGTVDRRFFSRNVMPILMAGLSGISTYFTAQGTPATSVATGGNQGNAAIIVDQAKATQEEARKQGIGDAIDKAVQRGNEIVNKAGSRPNQVEINAYTPIGVMFNAPVFKKQPQ